MSSNVAIAQANAKKLQQAADARIAANQARFEKAVKAKAAAAPAPTRVAPVPTDASHAS